MSIQSGKICSIKAAIYISHDVYEILSVNGVVADEVLTQLCLMAMSGNKFTFTGGGVEGQQFHVYHYINSSMQVRVPETNKLFIKFLEPY